MQSAKTKSTEGRVDGANDVEEGVAALDAAAQRALKHTQLGGEVEPRHGQRDFAGATELSSPLSSGPDGAV